MAIANQRGQIALLDVFLACVLFILLFVSITSAYQNSVNELISTKQTDQLKENGTRALMSLVESKGRPENWAAINDANVIGLLEKANVISVEKFQALKNWDYENAKRKLGLQSFEFNLELLDENGFLVDEAGRDMNSSNARILQRVMSYNNQIVKVNFIVWK